MENIDLKSYLRKSIETLDVEKEDTLKYINMKHKKSLNTNDWITKQEHKSNK